MASPNDIVNIPENMSEHPEPEHDAPPTGNNAEFSLEPIKVVLVDLRTGISEDTLIDISTKFGDFLGLLCDVSAELARKIDNPSDQIKENGLTLADGPWWYRTVYDSDEHEQAVAPEWLILDSSTAYDGMMEQLASQGNDSLTLQVQHNLQKVLVEAQEPQANASEATIYPNPDEAGVNEYTPSRAKREIFRIGAKLEAEPETDHNREQMAGLVYKGYTTTREGVAKLPEPEEQQVQVGFVPGPPILPNTPWPHGSGHDSQNFSQSANFASNQQLPYSPGPFSVPNPQPIYGFYPNQYAAPQPHHSAYPDLPTNNPYSNAYGQGHSYQQGQYVQHLYGNPAQGHVTNYANAGQYDTAMYGQGPSSHMYYPQPNWPGHAMYPVPNSGYDSSNIPQYDNSSSNIHGGSFSSPLDPTRQYSTYGKSGKFKQAFPHKKYTVQSNRIGRTRQYKGQGNEKFTRGQRSYGYEGAAVDSTANNHPHADIQPFNPDQYYRHPSVVAQMIKFGHADVVEPDIQLGPHYRPRAKSTGALDKLERLPSSTAIFTGMNLAREETNKATQTDMSAEQGDISNHGISNESTVRRSNIGLPFKSLRAEAPAMTEQQHLEAVAKLNELKKGASGRGMSQTNLETRIAESRKKTKALQEALKQAMRAHERLDDKEMGDGDGEKNEDDADVSGKAEPKGVEEHAGGEESFEDE